MDIWSVLLNKQAKIKTGCVKKDFTDFEVLYSRQFKECIVFIKESKNGH
jgi:hypothetical protein